jgi:3-carboxy-cis,cis-muconate cycloisomerase
LPFNALFLTDGLRAAVSSEAWVEAMMEAERALMRAQAAAGLIADAPPLEPAIDAEELARAGRQAGNPAEPLARRLRELTPDAHRGATSQDIVDTAMALVARRAGALVRRELDGVAAECARLAAEHRSTVMAGRTLLQQATPTTFGLKAAGWLVSVLEARELPALPAQLGGAAGTLAAFGDRGLDVRRLFAVELGLAEPDLTWHANRVPVAKLGAALAVAAGACAKIALDVQLLSQTEVGEVREPHEGASSTMPHKRNPVGSTLARACATTAQAAAGVLLRGVHEHERAAGAWHAEWKAVSDVLAYTGGAASWVRETLAGLEVDAMRMRENVRAETLSEAARFGGAERPEDYLGAAAELVDRALALYER